jgi:hypothetical protein
MSEMIIFVLKAERDQPSATFYHVNVTKVRTMNPDGQRPTSRKLSSKGSDVIQLKVCFN